MNPIAPGFFRAVPVWPEGREQKMNDFVGFRALVDFEPGQRAKLHVTACAFYRAWVNGKFLAYGPARAGEGHARVDELDLTSLLVNGQNVIAIEVLAYNVNTYVRVDEPAFLQAEVLVDGQVAAATGDRESPFAAIDLPEKIQKTMRYSFQRAFVEAYRLDDQSHRWRTDAAPVLKPLRLAQQAQAKLIARNVNLPNYLKRQPAWRISSGPIEIGPAPETPWREWMTKSQETCKGFPLEQLETDVSLDVQRVQSKLAKVDQPFDPANFRLEAMTAQVLDFGANLTGFICLKLTCAAPTKITMTFDELLSDIDVDFKRLGCIDAVTYDLKPGQYELETMEPYVLRYLKIWTTGAACDISGIFIREYVNPDADRATFASSDPSLARIFAAAVETYKQNAVDLFTDCPSRERAGWLCDSFYTARTAFDLCGNATVERNFLEIFLHPKVFPNIEPGMVAMCYPGDHIDGNYIPQWALWMILELREYPQRGGDRTLVDAMRPRVEGILNYFDRHKNSDGLCEKLGKWNFVEWSAANTFVQDVNYPTNMQWAAALDAGAELYDRKDWAEQARQIRDTVLAQAFDGEYFFDNAVRDADGKLVRTNNHTEVCQYFALFFNLVTPHSHPAFWERMLTQFGPGHAPTTDFPQSHRANNIVGNMLRFDLLSDMALGRQLLKELRELWLPMAQATTTLWEHNQPSASCNHGFASHAARWLYDVGLGVRKIDRAQRKVYLRFLDTDLQWAEGKFPLDDGLVEIRWHRNDGTREVHARVPLGYRVEIENNTSDKIVHQA